MSDERRFAYEIEQDGEVVARVVGPDMGVAFVEIMRHLRQYEQDGHCKMFSIADGVRRPVDFGDE
jgi:hypothetical protein